MAQAVEYLPSKIEALSSNSSIIKNLIEKVILPTDITCDCSGQITRQETRWYT
jgi:hypothetical protein